jgi:hypothetical protein
VWLGVIGAALVLAGVVIGLLIAPGVRGDSASAPTGSNQASGTAAGKPAPSRSSAAGKAPVPGVVPNFDPAQPVTVALGDSITFNPDSWFRQICSGGVLLQNCMNAGIWGNTTSQMQARLDVDVLVYKPALVFVMGGTNDLKRHESAKDIVRRLDLMVEKAQAVGATTVLCTIPPRNGYGPQVLTLNTAIRHYAARNNIPLLDMYLSVGTRKGVFKPGLTKDGIHPNLRGSDLMTAAAEQQLPTLLHPVVDAGQVGRLPPGR